MHRLRRWLVDNLMLLRLSIRLQLGRKFWIVPLLAMAWPLFHAIRLLIASNARSFNETDAQNLLIGLPMAIAAIGLGVGIIAGEIERRTLEVAYTVPGSARRIWIPKLIAVTVLLLLTETLLAIITAVFFTSFPLESLYGALQGAVFYLVLAMGLGALFRSEITAVLVACVLYLLNSAAHIGRWDPLFNPLSIQNISPSELLAWTVQNRIGFALAIIALAALAFYRAERREQLLGS